MVDPIDMESVNAIAVPAKGGFERLVGARRGLAWRDQPAAPGDAVDVGVDREGGAPQGEEKDARHRFGTNAGQGAKPPASGLRRQRSEGFERY